MTIEKASSDVDSRRTETEARLLAAESQCKGSLRLASESELIHRSTFLGGVRATLAQYVELTTLGMGEVELLEYANKLSAFYIEIIHVAAEIHVEADVQGIFGAAFGIKTHKVTAETIGNAFLNLRANMRRNTLVPGPENDAAQQELIKRIAVERRARQEKNLGVRPSKADLANELGIKNPIDETALHPNPQIEVKLDLGEEFEGAFAGQATNGISVATTTAEPVTKVDESTGPDSGGFFDSQGEGDHGRRHLISLLELEPGYKEPISPFLESSIAPHSVAQTPAQAHSPFALQAVEFVSAQLKAQERLNEKSEPMATLIKRNNLVGLGKYLAGVLRGFLVEYAKLMKLLSAENGNVGKKAEGYNREVAEIYNKMKGLLGGPEATADLRKVFHDTFAVQIHSNTTDEGLSRVLLGKFNQLKRVHNPQSVAAVRTTSHKDKIIGDSTRDIMLRIDQFASVGKANAESEGNSDAAIIQKKTNEFVSEYLTAINFLNQEIPASLDNLAVETTDKLRENLMNRLKAFLQQYVNLIDEVAGKNGDFQSGVIACNQKVVALYEKMRGLFLTLGIKNDFDKLFFDIPLIEDAASKGKDELSLSLLRIYQQMHIQSEALADTSDTARVENASFLIVKILEDAERVATMKEISSMDMGDRYEEVKEGAEKSKEINGKQSELIVQKEALIQLINEMTPPLTTDQKDLAHVEKIKRLMADFLTNAYDLILDEKGDNKKERRHFAQIQDFYARSANGLRSLGLNQYFAQLLHVNTHERTVKMKKNTEVAKYKKLAVGQSIIKWAGDNPYEVQKTESGFVVKNNGQVVYPYAESDYPEDLGENAMLEAVRGRSIVDPHEVDRYLSGLQGDFETAQKNEQDFKEKQKKADEEVAARRSKTIPGRISAHRNQIAAALIAGMATTVGGIANTYIDHASPPDLLASPDTMAKAIEVLGSSVIESEIQPDQKTTYILDTSIRQHAEDEYIDKDSARNSTVNYLDLFRKRDMGLTVKALEKAMATTRIEFTGAEAKDNNFRKIKTGLALLNTLMRTSDEPEMFQFWQNHRKILSTLLAEVEKNRVNMPGINNTIVEDAYIDAAFENQRETRAFFDAIPDLKPQFPSFEKALHATSAGPSLADATRRASSPPSEAMKVAYKALYQFHPDLPTDGLTGLPTTALKIQNILAAASNETTELPGPELQIYDRIDTTPARNPEYANTMARFGAVAPYFAKVFEKAVAEFKTKHETPQSDRILEFFNLMETIVKQTYQSGDAQKILRMVNGYRKMTLEGDSLDPLTNPIGYSLGIVEQFQEVKATSVLKSTNPTEVTPSGPTSVTPINIAPQQPGFLTPDIKGSHAQPLPQQPEVKSPTYFKPQTEVPKAPAQKQGWISSLTKRIGKAFGRG